MDLSEKELRQVVQEEIINLLSEQNEIGHRGLEDILMSGSSAQVTDFALDKEEGIFHLMVENEGEEYEIIFEASDSGTLNVLV